MKLSNVLGEKPIRFEKEWNGESFWFDLNPNYLTPSFLQSILDTDKNPIVIAKGLSEAMTNWSIWVNDPPEDWEDPTPGERRFSDFPPTAENIGKMPMDFIQFVIESMTETFQGNEKTQMKSAASSAAKKA